MTQFARFDLRRKSFVSIRIGSGVSYVIRCFLAIFIAVSFLLISSGTLMTRAFLAAAIVAWQVIGGVALYLTVMQPRRIHTSATISIGFALGMTSSVLANQLVLMLTGQQWGWFLPSLIGLFIFLSSCRKAIEWSEPTILGLLAACIALIPTTLTIWAFWRRWPLSGEPWWSVDGDAPVHESLAASLSTQGPSTSLAVLGQGIPYHWFADAWAGSLTRTIGADPYFSLTRILVVTATLAVASGLWALGRYFNAATTTKVALVSVATGSSFLTLGGQKSGSLLLVPFSPTFQYATVSLVALALVVLHGTSGRITWQHHLMAAALGVALAGGRTSHLLIACGGLSFILIGSLTRNRQFAKTLLLFAIFLVSSVFTTLLILQPEGSPSRLGEWNFRLNLDLPSSMGLIPFNSVAGFALSVLGALVAVLMGCTGVFWLTSSRLTWSWALAWSFGCGASGLLGVFALAQAGFSHFSVLGVGALMALAASGVGLDSAIRWLRRAHGVNWASRRIPMLWIVSALVGVGVSLVWPRLVGFRFDGLVRWAFLPLLLCLLIGAGYAIASQVKTQKPRTVFACVTVLAVLIPLVVHTAGTLSQIREPRSLQVDPYVTYAVTDADLAAGRWVQRNTPENGIFATNRLCNLPDDTPPYCSSGVFTISALGRRQALIEGQTYGVSIALKEEGSDLQWAIDRLNMSASFGTNPSLTSFCYLWNTGVRFYWVDQLVKNAEDWSPYASTIFMNERAKVLRLHSQTACDEQNVQIDGAAG